MTSRHEDPGRIWLVRLDLVPTSRWFTSIRFCVIPKDWERLGRMITSRAGERCEACGQTAYPSVGRRLEAHERSIYDKLTSVQTQRRLIGLGNQCHTVTPFGLAQIRAKPTRHWPTCAPSPA
jgi:hypothetical protein